MITAADVWERFEYDPITGEMIAKTGRMKGQSVGDTHVRGHRRLSINGQKHWFHRVVWLWMTGSWPDGQIDHINRVRDDNRWFNLRLSTPTLNSENQIGRGVIDLPNGKFGAKIVVRKKQIWLGTFNTEKEARHAYLEAKRQHHYAVELS